LAQGSSNEHVTDYEHELSQIESEIAEAELVAPELSERSRNPSNALNLVYLYYLRASLSGNFNHFKAAETAIGNALADFGPLPTLIQARAKLSFKLHRLDDTKHDLQALDAYSDYPPLISLWADIHLQEGDYARAHILYQRIADENPTWDALARLAYYQLNTDQPQDADRLYDSARAEVSVKQMRNYAWLELQKGIVDLHKGNYHQALAHYDRAQSEYSGYWLIEEHIAEVLHLLGRTDEAVVLY
jgi:tetratricopeptide (TPR) repeat protein